MIGIIKACSFGDICERPVAVVMVKNVRLAVVSYEKVVKAVVIVVTHAYSVRPAGMTEACALGHIREAAILVVVVQVVDGFCASGEPFQGATIQDE